MVMFKLAIVKVDSHEIVILPGGGPLEIDLVEACVAAVSKRGVGFWRGQSHVEADIRAGLTEVIRDLKHRTIQVG